MDNFKWAEAIEERRYYIIDSNSYNEHNTTTDGYYMRPDEWVLLEVIGFGLLETHIYQT